MNDPRTTLEILIDVVLSPPIMLAIGMVIGYTVHAIVVSLK